MEVETPILQVSPGLEPHLFAFQTTLESPVGDKQTLYLHTSPEFAMKKLMVAGVKKQYQLARVFRNREGGTKHSPEFTMLEWYRTNDSYETLMRDCVELVQHCALAAGRKDFSYDGKSCDPFAEWQRLSVPEAFKKFCNIDLLATIDDDKNPSPDKLRDVAKNLELHVADDDRWEDIFFRVLGTKIEPMLGVGVPTILRDYPISQAALARACPKQPRLAERFELYICGLELVNAFGELTDATEQRARFMADMDLKERLYGERYPIDEDFLAALNHGLPPSAGAALGFDRLAMLCAGAHRIEDVLWAPTTPL